MILYTWTVWKNCRIVGYVSSYSEYDALKAANNKYGSNIFIERTLTNS